MPSKSRNVQPVVGSEPFELDFLLQAVARHVALNFGHHPLDGFNDLLLIAVLG